MAARVRLGSWNERSMRAASRAEPDALLISIYSERRIARGGLAVRVPPRVALILAALFVGRLLSIRDIIDLLFGDDPEGGPDHADRIVSKDIQIVRIVGAMLGIVIHTATARGYSARLVEVTLAPDRAGGSPELFA